MSKNESVKYQAEVIYQSFGGSKQNAIKCVDLIIKATIKEGWSSGSGSFIGSTSKKKYTRDPYWLAVKEYIRKNK